jgi:metal-dependent amidase/aminoacylase/carboxypeptidase family protein
MMLSAFHSIKSRSMDSRKNIVFSICHFDSGQANNVFPDSAIIRGTIRCYDLEAKEVMIKRINQIATEIAKAHDC